MSKVYDNQGREKQSLIVIDWTNITGIPDRVNEIAVLTDPASEFYYVGWDNVANQLKLRIFDPLNIPYDNTTSGLTATNVQDAIDELAASVAAIVSASVYPGYVGSDGTTGNRLPAGWSATRTGAGVYEVTHNLGLTDRSYLSVAHSVADSAGNKNSEELNTGTGNKFVIQVVDSGTGTPTDQAFKFLAQRN